MDNIGPKMVEIAEAAVASMSAKEVHEKRQAGEPIVILDVREPDEWENGVIEDAVLLSRGRIESRLEELAPDKDGLIVTH